MLLVLVTFATIALAADTAGDCDLDADGHDALFCGGADCNDDDVSVHPDAEEIPEDGLDQDCDGYDVSAGATWTGSGGSLLCGGGTAPAAWLVGVAALLVRRRQ